MNFSLGASPTSHCGRFRFTVDYGYEDAEQRPDRQDGHHRHRKQQRRCGHRTCLSGERHQRASTARNCWTNGDRYDDLGHRHRRRVHHCTGPSRWARSDPEAPRSAIAKSTLIFARHRQSRLQLSALNVAFLATGVKGQIDLVQGRVAQGQADPHRQLGHLAAQEHATPHALRRIHGGQHDTLASTSPYSAKWMAIWTCEYQLTA